MRRFTARIILTCLCLALLPAVSQAADNDIARLRVESLDALAADVERLAAAVGQPVSRDMLLGMGLQAMGIQSHDWIDGKRPIVVVFPLQGMSLGPAGIVGALPVSDAAPALNALEGMFKTHGIDGEVHTFSNETGGAPIVAVARDGYLLVGGNADLLQGFDLSGVLTRGALPPGNIALDIHLEPIAPLALGGLEQGRQMFMQNLETAVEDAEAAEPEEEVAPDEEAPAPAGDEPATADEPEPAEEPQAEYAAGGETEPPFDPAAIAGIMDLYFDVLRDTINNVSHFQLSVEAAPGHAILHQRLIPRGGSTLAELVAAQEGGFPDLARLIDAERATYAWAGQIKITPRAREAVLGYAQSYFSALDGLFSEMGDEGVPFSNLFGALMTNMEPLVGSWLDCMRGDFAGAFHFNAGGGISAQQALGAGDIEACATVLDLGADLWSGLDDAVDSDEAPISVSVTKDALIYQGVNAQKQTFNMDLSSLGETKEAGEALRATEAMWGEDGMVSYTGLADDVMLTTTGPDSEAEFKTLVDRVKGKGTGGGLTAASLAPFGTGPGMSGWMDIGELFKFVAEMVPEGEDEAELEMFKNMPEGAARFVFGGSFDESSLNMGFAVPMEFLNFVGEMVRKEQEAEAAEAEAGEEAHAEDHDHHHGHDHGEGHEDED